MNTKKQMKWGSITWCFFHTLAEQIHPIQYQNEKHTIMSLIRYICSGLPCPDCSAHATQYMLTRAVPPDKESFKRMMSNFHNEVNSRTGKPYFTEDKLTQYKSLSLTEVFHACKHAMMHQPYNPRLSMHKLRTTDSMNKVHTWLGKQGLITH